MPSVIQPMKTDGSHLGVGILCLRNRQRTRAVDLRLLRRIAQRLLAEHFHPQHFELCVHLVAAPEMARVNETFLHHPGSTDVITFNHADPSQTERLHGELFICLDDAVAQAKQFRTTWQCELTRYLIHGLLHLRGHDDLAPAPRRAMKREENRLLRELARRFPLSDLARKQKLTR